VELTPEQSQAVREAFARGKEAERQYVAGLPVSVALLSGTKPSHSMRLTPDENRMLDELRTIRAALADASEATRMILAANLAQDWHPRSEVGPDDWLEAVDGQIYLLETSIDPEHIATEMVRRGFLSAEEAGRRDFSAAGNHTPYARREAVEVLRRFWVERHGVGSDARGGHENTSEKTGNYYRFNAFVTFVGAHLLAVDPTLETGKKSPRRQGDPTGARTGLEQACYRAWLILGDLRE
jgi:hypothetical protein